MTPLRPANDRQHCAGFTLTELMVAITGGLLLSMGLFAIARDSTRFYRREARVSDATLAAVVGFQRLQTDLQRAGFMATPNIAADTRLCGPRPTSPRRIAEMGAIRITDGPDLSLPDEYVERNSGIRRDAIIIAGNMTSTDEFLIKGVQGSGTGGYIVTLQTEIGPLARMGFSALSDEQKTAILADLFGPGRALRIVDLAGRHYYGEISGTALNGAVPVVLLSSTPAIELRTSSASASGCGLTPTSTGYANVVNFVRYELRAAAEAEDAATDLTEFEATRTDLVRFEVDAQNQPIEDTVEVIAEYAVDLRFGVTVLDAANVDTATQSDVRAVESGEEGIEEWTGDRDPANTTIGRPDRIRAVRATLSLRSPLPDRHSDVVAGAPGIYRVFLGSRDIAGETREYWARVRTLQADVGLRNTEGIVWP